MIWLGGQMVSKPALAVVAGGAALVVAGAAAVSFARRGTLRAGAAGARSFRFDPDRIAYFEAAGWRAYYDRRWARLLRLTVALCQEQFHIPFPRSLLAAYYVTRGALAWAPVNHDARGTGVRQARAYYERFFRMARRYSGLRFDPVRVAGLELQYWKIHRPLVGQADKSAFVQTMVDLHSAIFGLTAEQARESAEWRVSAANTVDRITGGRSTDVEADWARLEADLRRCYRSIQRALATS
jgi:hypothetical protein